ncbi:hypothetical protein ACNKHX_07420 [Shigella flexneri]
MDIGTNILLMMVTELQEIPPIVGNLYGVMTRQERAWQYKDLG